MIPNINSLVPSLPTNLYLKYLFRGTTSTLTVPETQTENDQRPTSSTFIPEMQTDKTENDQRPTSSTIVPETQTDPTETQPIPDVNLSSDDGDDDENGGNEYEEKIQSESER